MDTASGGITSGIKDRKARNEGRSRSGIITITQPAAMPARTPLIGVLQDIISDIRFPTLKEQPLAGFVQDGDATGFQLRAKFFQIASHNAAANAQLKGQLEENHRRF